MKPNTTTHSIKKRLCKVIESSGKSQAEIARQLNTTPAMVSRWKNGAVIPTTKSYEKLCKFLMVDINWLLTGISSNDKYKTIPSEDQISGEFTNTSTKESKMELERKYLSLLEDHLALRKRHDAEIDSKNNKILDLENLLAKSKAPTAKKIG